MGLFSKAFKSKDAGSARSKHGATTAAAGQPIASQQKQSYEDGWVRKDVAPHEVQELINVCTQEMKSRALDTPFLLLPFRPTAENHISAARTFVRSFFRQAGSPQYQGENLSRELRLYDPMVLCSIIKWCWSRLPGGVVTWNTYELFKEGEQDSKYAKHAFDTLIPLSVDSEARKFIVFDFFDLLAAIAAHGKTNGLGGRKLSRLAGWWAFEHSDNGNGFNGGYRSWAHAADATCHLFFAHLRSLAPDPVAGSSGISQLPRSLQSLVSQTEYPPETPILLQSETSKVIMVVDSVSPTPFALLRRAKHFEYRDADETLQRFAAYDDPVKALTFECRRVLDSISATNRSANGVPVLSNSVKGVSNNNSQPDASWSRFEDIGFGSLLDGSNGENGQGFMSRPSDVEGQVKAASLTTDFGRPTTPSWADFLSSGFADDGSTRGPASSLLLPPDQILPPLSPARVQSSQSHLRGGLAEDKLEPGELASVTRIALDETFWWVWMTSLSGEETATRKSVFGRCAFLETEIPRARWLIIEEQVKGAAAKAPEDALLVEKKSRFGLSKKDRTRRSSTGRKPLPTPKDLLKKTTTNESRITVGADQRARVQAAAAGLVEGQKPNGQQEKVAERRGRLDENAQSKTNSVMTLQPVIMKEAAPAMQWARKFDKETIRAKYLGDVEAGRGQSLVEGANSAEQPEQPEPSVAQPIAAPSAPVEELPAYSNGMAVDPVADTAAAEHTRKRSTSSVIERKPVPGSPAAIQTNVTAIKKQNSTTSPKSPAAAAASAALASATAAKATEDPTPEPASQPGRVTKSKQGSTRNLINLFNKKKQPEGPEAAATSKDQYLSAGDPKIGRKRSLLGRKLSQSAPKETAEETAPIQPKPEASQQEPGSTRGPAVYNDPAITTPAAQAAAAAMYQSERNVSTAQFSNFTQGSQENQAAPDVPAAVEPTLASSPPPESRPSIETEETEQHFAGSQEPAGIEDDAVPSVQAAAVDEEPQAAAGASQEGEASEDGGAITKQISHDRWQQIKQNATERARKNSETKTDKTDDGDTSGEETIESRVARIKARVAELTGQQPPKASAMT